MRKCRENKKKNEDANSIAVYDPNVLLGTNSKASQVRTYSKCQNIPIKN